MAAASALAMPKLLRGELHDDGSTGYSGEEDFYPASVGSTSSVGIPEASRNKHQAFNIGTPRFSIVPMGTPREPEKGNATGNRYVPHWPYSSQWPFCCAPTTLELRNLPRNVTPQVLVSQLNTMGLASRCNYVHIAGGVAHVNCLRHADGLELAAKLHAFRDWEESAGKKACRVAWSFTRQGMEDLLWSTECAEEVWSEDGEYSGAWVAFQPGAWVPAVNPPELDDGSIWVTQCVYL
eukprot:CAMPEP_0206436166 /NCGR_PEP_ID=MMETSP0324_2-20121206/10322_1 /ASSEMBLY_ACC=CAM_ASM_000836 /TAXON_ID=2866 /ORGANISM="Crypthecodinium cohnii, Strain Seligo" /LENGTH=236 /DNA_ID=CAMNT_0053903281 /DNA_START=27 /DNA_END=737 /DNA_ORIENTATION=-